MGELVGAVGRVQLRKLPGIIRRMRASKRRIKKTLEGTPGVTLRRLNDEAGDTGSFLILILDGAPRALEAVKRLKSSGVESACRVADYGLHVYCNVPQLAGTVPLSVAGNPWSLPANRESRQEYARGACPRSDELFERSVIVPVPSCLSRDQEKAAARILREAAL
jgi:8-amino-3,8-dideoxy-alpha-D-manno-octulosonate transaminase